MIYFCNDELTVGLLAQLVRDQRSRVRIRYKPEFFSGLFFRTCISNRPYSRYPPSLDAPLDRWDISNVTWFLRGQTMKKISNTSNRGRIWLCIKLGRGQGDGDKGTRVWGLGTWGHQVWDTGRCGTGRRDVKYRDAGTSNTGTRGTLMFIAKVRIKCDISFFVKMCYLLSTLSSIVQNHIGHLRCLHKIFPYIGVSALIIVIRVKHC